MRAKRWCIALVNSSEISNETKELKRGNIQKSFITDVATLVSGTTLAQVILILSSPFITRIYGADAFGLSALFTSMTNVIAVAACLRYELAIMLPKTDEDAANLLALSLLLALTVSLTLVPIIWLFGDDLAYLLNAPNLQPYLWLVPPMVFLKGAFSAINYWNSRQRQFGRLSRAQVSRAITTSGTQIGVGFAGHASGGSLIGAGVIGQAVATSALSYQAWKSDYALLREAISWNIIRRNLNNYRDFLRFDIWSALLNALSLQIPIFVLSAFFTSTIVGYYSLGLMVLQLPMTFIGTAIGQVFYQRAAEAKHEGTAKMALVVESTTKRLIAISFPLILILLVIGRDAFIVAFGTDWAEAGVYAQILSFWILASFIASPLSTIFSILKKLKLLLYLNIVLLIVRFAVLVIGGVYDDIYLCLFLLSISGAMIYAAMGYWILKESRVSLLRLYKPISKYLVIGLSIICAIAVLKYLFVLNPITTVVMGAVGLTIYFIIIFNQDNELKLLFSKLIRRG